MRLKITTDPNPLREDLGGAIRVGPTRVTLETLLHSYKRGESPEEIADSFSTLNIADIYSVIGYYLRHQSEVDAYLKQVEEEEALRRKVEAQPGYQEWRRRLLDRRAAVHEPQVRYLPL